MIKNGQNQMMKPDHDRGDAAAAAYGLQPWAIKMALRAQALMASRQTADISIIRTGDGRYIRVNGGDLEKVG